MAEKLRIINEKDFIKTVAQVGYQLSQQMGLNDEEDYDFMMSNAVYISRIAEALFGEGGNNVQDMDT